MGYYPEKIYAQSKVGSNGIECLDYRNFEHDIEYIRADLVEQLQKAEYNTAYTKCSCELAELQRSSSVIDSIKIMGILKKHFV